MEHVEELDQHHGHDDSPEAIRKEIRKYLYVLGALGVLTLITVAISRLHLPTGQAVALALLVATIKGSLVAAFFMHLISERRLIYAVLALTVVFFAVLMWVPIFQHSDAEKAWPGHDINASQPAKPAAPHSGH